MICHWCDQPASVLGDPVRGTVDECSMHARAHQFTDSEPPVGLCSDGMCGHPACATDVRKAETDDPEWICGRTEGALWDLPATQRWLVTARAAIANARKQDAP